MAAKLSDLLTAVKTTIQGLNLTGIADDNVVVQLVADWEGGAGATVPGLPAVLIAPMGAETVSVATNISDDISYPIGVIIMSAENRDQSTHRDRNLQWRESIRLAFSQQRLLPAFRVEVRPMSVAVMDEWKSNKHSHGLLLVCTVREQTR